MLSMVSSTSIRGCLKRIELYTKFKEGEKRILVSTNLIARGIDIQRVNLVINYDMATESATYLHRVS